MFFGRNLTRRDALLVLLGASSMHIWSLLLRSISPLSPDLTHVNQLNQVNQVNQVNHLQIIATTTETERETATATATKVVTHIKTSDHLGDGNGVQGGEWDYGSSSYPSSSIETSSSNPLPPTTLLSHAPGWTLFRNLYMSNGTLFIVTNSPAHSPSDNRPQYRGPKNMDLRYGYTKAKGFPEIRMMISMGLSAVNSPENIALREPRRENLQFLSVDEAVERWGAKVAKGKEEAKEHRVWVVKGNTLLFNDPSQFLRHYYHFVAELFFGVQAFWHSAFLPQSLPLTSTSPEHYALKSSPAPPPIHRAIFVHSNADGWRDNPGFNSYFLRAAYPSLTVEHQEDWDDRVRATRGGLKEEDRVWRFPLVLLTDRSAAHHGVVCGGLTQRTAAEAWEQMRLVGRLRGIHVGGWWAPVREAMWRFAGWKGGVAAGAEVVQVALDSGVKAGDDMKVKNGLDRDGEVKAASVGVGVEPVNVGNEHQKRLPMPEKVVVTYISRQSARVRKLTKEAHEGLVAALHDLVKRKNDERLEVLKKEAAEVMKAASSPSTPSSNTLEWELQVLEAEHLSKDEQIRAAARTTILLGVHGNGLTHLVFMQPTRLSSVIEIFCPDGFAHDYWWTTRALGMRHWAVWNDTARTYPDKPHISYPNCFQGNAIPVHGPAVAQLIEDRVAGKL